MTMRRDLLVLVVLVALAPLLFLGAAPILQPAAYHELADQRSLLGIGHFWNVVSNLPFLVVGLMGLDLLRRRPEEAAAGWAALFCGNVLVAFGSAWYHSNPNDATLIWEGHKAGRHIGYCHLEKLHNLDQLPSTGFTVSCFPVKIERASAGWTRAVAIIDS